MGSLAYVPVAWHLGNLRAKFEWAETHQAEVKKMSDAASNIFDRMMGEKYMQRLYQELFVDTWERYSRPMSFFEQVG